MNRQNKMLWILMLAISVVMSSIISVSVATNAYINELQLSKEQVYGSFTHIVYNSKNTTIDDSNRYGVIDIFDASNDKDIVYGKFNDLAKNLGNINIPSLSENEVVITQEIAQKYQLKEGELWKVEGKDWRVKAVIDNVGLLWIRGTVEQTPVFKMPNVIVDVNNWQKLIGSVSEFRRIWLANLNINEKNVEWESIQGNHYRNTFLEKNTDNYHTPEYLFNITSIIFCIILIIMLRAYILSVRKRYDVYGLLGMSRTHLKRLFLLEFLCFNILAIVFGVLLCLLITSLFLSVALRKIYIVDGSYFWGYFLKYSVMYGITVIMSLLLFASFPFKKRKRNKVFHKKIPFDFKKINLSLNIGFFSILIVFLVGNLFLNFEAINSIILSSNAVGKIVNDSDYEFVFTRPSNRQGEFYYNGNYHEIPQNIKEKYRIQYMKSSGELNHIQQQLSQKFPSAQFESYINLSEIYLVNKDNLFQQDYLQKLYSVKLIQDRPFWNELLNQSVNLLTIRAIAYPDDKINLISSHFSGDVQSVINGESAYLVAPAYQYFESFDPVNQVTFKEAKPIDKDDVNAVYDDRIKENDLVSVISLNANSSVYGNLDSESAKRIFDIKHLNVLVGGIAYKQVGWLDTSDITEPYRLIVSKNFLEKNDLDQSVTRLRMKIPNLDYGKDDSVIRQIVANYPNVKIVDQYGQLQTFRQYHFIQQGFKILLTVIFFVLTIVIFNSLIQAHMFEQNQKYLVYGLLGMPRNRLVTSLGIPIVCSMMLSIIGISILEVFLFFGRINILSARDWTSLFVYIVLPMIICMVIALILTYRHIKKFMNTI
ncbi:hypothetical protein GMA11_07145 [Granulicatella sp. zg-ZJ]|uniref:ABC transporter permease n=1 Tax=Granulicatella sp. zg-ZJ TaxID=2678504 RepID=UPI0013D7EEAF|nr:ABC transporter permease [Granulicatella sp. zg-ZJ]NEW62306.1 hypothetical protein [Granulicatella sp. zg-ZJ]NEW63168.1 hypothetical protein [Granulicatella sp. zg-ZJ]